MTAPAANGAESSYRAASPRERLRRLLDPGSFRELAPAGRAFRSPHLESLGIAPAGDDGVVLALGALDARPVAAASQDGGFLGGSIGEVHAARVAGLLQRALRDRLHAVVLGIDSGGARLQEGNAALAAVALLLRAVLDTRAGGVPVIALVGGPAGCFGGASLVAGCCDAVVIGERARMGYSGPRLIEAVAGGEGFDASDAALVERTVGARRRHLIGDTDALVEDRIGAFRAALRDRLGGAAGTDRRRLGAQQAALAARLAWPGGRAGAGDPWRALVAPDPAALPVADFVRAAARLREAPP